MRGSAPDAGDDLWGVLVAANCHHTAARLRKISGHSELGQAAGPLESPWKKKVQKLLFKGCAVEKFLQLYIYNFTLQLISVFLFLIFFQLFSVFLYISRNVSYRHANHVAFHTPFPFCKRPLIIFYCKYPSPSPFPFLSFSSHSSSYI